MLKTIIVTFTLLTYIIGYSQEEHDFRNVDWKMNKEQVRLSESSQPKEETDSTLSFDANLGGQLSTKTTVNSKLQFFRERGGYFKNG